MYKKTNYFFELISAFLLLITTSIAFAHQIEIYGHRGTRWLEPENTLPAYKATLSIGVDVVDMDVNMTKDGVVVVTHNFALNPAFTRAPNGRFLAPSDFILIRDLTLKQLQRYDVGQLNPNSWYAQNFPDQRAVPGTHIPTLQQVIDYVNKYCDNPKMKFQIELKTDPRHPEWTFPPKKLADEVVKIVEKNHLVSRVEIQAFDWRCLQEVQKQNPHIATAYLTDAERVINMSSPNKTIAGLWVAGYFLKNYANSIPKMIKTLGGTIWGPDYRELTPKNIKEAHQLGLRVVTWTPDTPAAIDRLITLHVDGLITDRPALARGILMSKGYSVSKPSFRRG